MALSYKSVGEPVMTGSGGGSGYRQINGDNFSTASLLQIISHHHPEVAAAVSEGIPFWFDSNYEIHDRAWFRMSAALPVGFMRWYQPVGYELQTPSDIVGDLLVNQMYCQHGRIRIGPSGDQLTTGWNRNPATGTFASKLDEGVANYDPADSVYITSLNTPIELQFYDLLPPNCTYVYEIRAKIWGSIVDGNYPTLTPGHCFDLVLRMNTTPGTPGSGTQVGDTRYAFFPVHNTTTKRAFYETRWRRISGMTQAKGNRLTLELTPKDYLYSLGPFVYGLYAIDLEVIYFTSDIQLVDETSFTDGLFSSYWINQFSLYDYKLTGDFININIGEAIATVCSHGPEMMLMFDNETRWRGRIIPDYADTASPYQIGPGHGNYTHLERSWEYDERLATKLKLNYGTRRGDGLDATPGASDPSNSTAWKITTNEFGYKERLEEEEPEQDREWLPASTDMTTRDYVMFRYLDVWDRLFGAPIRADDVGMPHSILVPQLGDVVALDISELGLSNVKRLVVKKEIDLDEITGTLYLYDLSFTDDT